MQPIQNNLGATRLPEVRIPLLGRDTFVAQEFLDAPQTHACDGQPTGERVSERMRRQSLRRIVSLQARVYNELVHGQPTCGRSSIPPSAPEPTRSSKNCGDRHADRPERAISSK